MYIMVHMCSSVLHLLVVAKVAQEDGEGGVDELPHHEHGFAVLGTKHAEDVVEETFLCSLHNPLVAGGILSFLNPILSPHLHLKVQEVQSVD